MTDFSHMLEMLDNEKMGCVLCPFLYFAQVNDF